MSENMQILFDKAVSDMIKQGKKSVDGGKCRYRSDAGCCAVGHLISDEVYEEVGQKLEGKSAHAEEVLDAIEKSCGLSVSGQDERMLADLQEAHDKSPDNEFFKTVFLNRAEDVADTFGLEFNHKETK